MSRARDFADLASSADAGGITGKNLIINGAMQVAQRGTSETGVTSGGYLTCDRWQINLNGLGTWTVDQSTDSPDEFSNSLKVTCTTADASPAASDIITVRSLLEAQNFQGLGFGTSNAKTLTLSFWVKSNKTGNASFDIYQPDNSNRMFTDSYSISVADTWEYKTIVISGDTSGLIANDNGAGLVMDWTLNSGSTYTTGSHSEAWAAYNAADRNASNLGVGGAISDYFAITGVQLEVGEQATPFEHRSYADEFLRCARYCYRWESENTSSHLAIGFCRNNVQGRFNVFVPVPLRSSVTADLTLTSSGTWAVLEQGTQQNSTGITISGCFKESIAVLVAVASGLAQGDACQLRALSVGDYIQIEAEL